MVYVELLFALPDIFSGCYDAPIKHEKWDCFKTSVYIRRCFAFDGRNYSICSSTFLVSIASKWPI